MQFFSLIFLARCVLSQVIFVLFHSTCCLFNGSFYVLFLFFFTFCLFFYILWQIGAVNGSEEFKLGVTMNADMKGIAYASVIYSDVRTHPCDVNEAKRKSVRQLRKSLN